MHLISPSLVNLITLISGDIASNFYAKRTRTYELVCSFSHSGQIKVTCCCYLGASWTETKLFISLHSPLSVLCSLSVVFLMIHCFPFVLFLLPLRGDDPSPFISLWRCCLPFYDWNGYFCFHFVIDWPLWKCTTDDWIITCREMEVWSI